MPLVLQIELTLGIILFIVSTFCGALLKMNYDDWYSDSWLNNTKGGYIKIIITGVGTLLFVLWLIFIAVTFIWHLY